MLTVVCLGFSPALEEGSPQQGLWFLVFREKMITCQVLTMPNTTCTREDAPLGVLSQEFGLLLTIFLRSLTSASSLVHLTLLFRLLPAPYLHPNGCDPLAKKNSWKNPE